MERKIKKIITGSQAVDGAGVKLTRVIGYRDVKDMDPFLMLDGFDSTNPADYVKGFPWHPHRGIETVTYLISGEIEHGDSLGNKGTIHSGGCQWMTAGSGIMHYEMPKPADRMLGCQLWLNLPAKNKMTTPEYGDISADMVAVVKQDNYTVRVVAGEFEGVQGKFQGKYVPASYLDFEIQPYTEIPIPVKSGETVFAYVFLGGASFGESYLSAKQLGLFTDGEYIKVKSDQKGIRFILLSGKPLNEPISWGGPIVMNTREELNKAFEELDEGTFIKTNAK